MHGHGGGKNTRKCKPNKKNCNKTPGTQIYNTRNRFFIKEKIQIK